MEMSLQQEDEYLNFRNDDTEDGDLGVDNYYEDTDTDDTS